MKSYHPKTVKLQTGIVDISEIVIKVPNLTFPPLGGFWVCEVRKVDFSRPDLQERTRAISSDVLRVC